MDKQYPGKEIQQTLNVLNNFELHLQNTNVHLKLEQEATFYLKFKSNLSDGIKNEYIEMLCKYQLLILSFK